MIVTKINTFDCFTRHKGLTATARVQGGVGRGWMPPQRVLQNFETKIYTIMLELSVTVHSSFAEISTCQLSFHVM